MKINIKKIFSKKYFIWFALILILIISVILFFVFNNSNKLVIKKHDLYYYMLGVKFDLKGNIKFDKSGDITQLSVDNEEEVYLDTTPIYYKDELKSIFPKTVSIVFPISGKQYKVNFYATVYNEIGDILLNDGSYKKVVKDAVIYDGKDIYYFFDRCTVTFDDHKFELNPMSYIVVDVINDSIYIYDYDKDKIFNFTNSNSDVIISTDSYKINATLDLYYYDKGSRLLIRNVNQLSNLK